MTTLVVVACGRRKIWDKHPGAGAVQACDAYIGSPFKLNRKYAEALSTTWVILSAKYGFLLPDAIIGGPYNVTFGANIGTHVSAGQLRRQIIDLRLGRFGSVVVLGGQTYGSVVKEAFDGLAVQVLQPLSGLKIGQAMRLVNEAIALLKADGVAADSSNPGE